MKIPRWALLENTNRLRWKRDYVSICYVGRVFHVLRIRNSYNWSDSVQYFTNGAFHPNIEDAKKYVESNRERGSYWKIEEYPALVICGSKYALCMVSANQNGDFNFASNLEITHKSLDKIASNLDDHSSNSTFIYRTKLDEVAPLIAPLGKFTSISHGGEYKLGWIETRKSITKLSNIFDLQKKIWLLI
jgi:hypothetical protein